MIGGQFPTLVLVLVWLGFLLGASPLLMPARRAEATGQSNVPPGVVTATATPTPTPVPGLIALRPSVTPAAVRANHLHRLPDGAAGPDACDDGSGSAGQGAGGTARVDACGSLTADTVWTAGNVYVIDGCTVTVEAGASLTIEPGTIVKLAGSHDKVIVNGELRVAGTAGSPVVLTSLRDDSHGGDTNGDGAATAPARGDWGWIVFTAGSRGTIRHAVLGYGGVGASGYTAWAMVKAYGTSNVSVEHTTLRKSWSSALYAENASISVSNSRIAGSGLYAGSYGLDYEGLGADAALVLTENVFETEQAGESAARVKLGPHPAEIVMRGNSASGSGRNGVVLTGTVERDLRLEVADSVPLIIDGALAVAAGATLTLAPGTIIKPSGCGGKLNVDGALVAVGTEADPIAFTSLKDDSRGGDTNGDGTASAPQPSDWGYVRFNAGSTGTLKHVFFGYGGVGCTGYDTYTMLRATEAVVDVEYATFAAFRWTAVHSSEAHLSIQRSRFSGGPPDNPTAIDNAGTRLWVDARFNWWGDPSGPYNAARNPNGRGTPVSDRVRFFPWAIDADGTIPTQVSVYGPSRVSPGDTVDYGLDYFAGSDLTDALLILLLPRTAAPLETGGGIYWPERHQIFWKLGNLAGESAGQRSVRLRHRWGVPSGTQDRGVGFVAAGELSGGETDVTAYRGYAPLLVASEHMLSDAEIAAERAADATVHALVAKAEQGGQKLGSAFRFTYEDGSAMTQFLLLDDRGVTFVHRRDSIRVASTFLPSGYEASDGTGGMRIDLETGHVTPSGAWADPLPPLEGGGAGDPFRVSDCLANCMAKGNLLSVARTTDEALLHFLHAPSCRKWLHKPNARPDFNDKDWWACVYKELTLPGEVNIITGCVTRCRSDKRWALRCKAGNRLARCVPNPKLRDASTLHESTKVDSYDEWVCDAASGRWLGPAPKRCPRGTYCFDTLNYWEESETEIPCGECVDNRVSMGGGAATHATHGTCSSRHTEVAVARDPNEKTGPVGDVLPGQAMEFHIAYENEGAGTAYDVYVTDELAAVFDETSLATGPADYFAGPRTLFWEVGDLAPKGEAGSKGELSFTVNLLPGLPEGTVVRNQAVVYFPSVPEETATNTVVNVVHSLVAVPHSVATTYRQPVAITMEGRSLTGAPVTFQLVEGPIGGETSGAPPNLTYTPGENFTGHDRITFTVSDGTGVSRPADVAILVAPSGHDQVSPTVSWTYPENGAVVQNVPADPIGGDDAEPLYAPSVLVGFSEAMDPVTVSAATVAVTGPGAGDVAAVVTWDGTVNRAVLTPRTPWQDGMYAATVTTGVRDASGNPLATAFSWSFRIGPSPGLCTGDCNGDGTVTVDDLVQGVNIALGLAPIDQCSSFDANADGLVTIDEIIAGVTNALVGCQVAPPTPAPTPTPTAPLGPPTRSPTPAVTATLAPTPAVTPSGTATPAPTSTRTVEPSATYTAAPTETPSVVVPTRTAPGGTWTATPTVPGGADLYCSSRPAPLPIPDDYEGGVSDSLIIPGDQPIVKLRVRVRIAHPWVGDLAVTLVHADTLSTAALLFRPGDAEVGCSSDDVDCTFDDVAAEYADDQCASPPAIRGSVIPTEPLQAFAGERRGGEWMLFVSDMAPGDTGHLSNWCLEIE